MVIEGQRAVRLVAIKLLLLSASLAAIGAAMPGHENGSIAEATWGGMKLMHLILATASSGASLFFRRQLDRRELAATVVCGVLFGVAGPPVLSWVLTWWSDGKIAALPAPVENMAAIFLGVLGVYIVPALQSAGEAFKKNPLGFVPWLKGGATAPPPGSEDKQGGQP
jgi:hypothetical protein